MNTVQEITVSKHIKIIEAILDGRTLGEVVGIVTISLF